MSEWRAVKLHPRLLMGLVLLILGLSAFRFWNVREGAAAAEQSGLQPRPELLVEAKWLSERLTGSAYRIVDLRPLAEYQAGHIPGAVYFDAGELFTERGGIQAMLPELSKLQALIRQAGIAAETIVVAYDGNSGLSAARLFFALDYAGQGKGRVLNGGWGEWSAAGLPTSTEVPQVVPSDFAARAQEERLADAAWILAHLDDDRMALLDARSAREYEGKSGNARRLGHIPGAAWLEWTDSLSPGTQRLRPPDELLALLSARGITPNKVIAPYCQSFARGAQAYFMLRWLGYPRVRGYDGSWFEWGNLPDTPVEQGAPPAPLTPSGAAEPAEEPSTVQLGMTEAAVQRLLGQPQQVEQQNPCWGKQSVWRYTSLPQAQGPLRLTFLDGVLRQITR